MKTSTKITIALIVLICLGFIIIPRLDLGGEKIAAPATPQSGPVLQVNAIVAKNEPLDNNLKVTGSLTANESVTLKSEVSGIVEKIAFKEGQKVRKGQVLVKLNDDELRAELEKLMFTKKLNEDIEYRQKQLLKKEAISKEEYETALTTLNTSAAEIKVKQVQIEKHEIKAPFDGIIGLRNVSAGSYLNPSDEIATLYNINPIKIDFSIPGRYTAEANVGDKISFTVDAYKDTFYGEIYAIEPQINPQTRSIRLRAVSENKAGKLLPGQFTRIILTISTFENALMVPTESVIPELDGKKVYIKINGKVESRAVETGIRTADNVQITSGISVGDTVITTGILQVKPGMPIKVNLGDVTYE